MATDRVMRYWSLLFRKAEQLCDTRRVESKTMSLCSWHQTVWLQRWCWAGVWTAKGESRGWGNQHHWAQAGKVNCPASPDPQCRESSWVSSGRPGALGEGAFSIPAPTLVACSAQDLQCQGAQWVLSMGSVLPFPFHGHSLAQSSWS